MQIQDLVLIDGVRTPMAEFNGPFADVSAIELGALAAKALFERTGVDPGGDRPHGGRQRPADLGRRDLRRPPRRPQGRRAEGGSGADREPPLRFRHSGDRLRVASHPRRRGAGLSRRWHGEHDAGAAPGPRSAQGAAARQRQARRPALGVADGSVLRLLHGADLEQPGARLSDLARGAGRLRGLEPGQGGRRHGGGQTRGRDRARSRSARASAR